MSRGRIVAVLGPTNTGKTHLAIDRMLGHASGMIGFPLRLLARENYDRVVARMGRGRVALVTGEEKIVPKGARYFLCTVESMPVARETEFLAIDEIQLCADPERGHVFTDRLLHARGQEETMFMGAETIRPLLRRLVPTAEIETRPRFSRLSHSGAQKLSRLARRSAIVGFSINDVYRVAEQMRRHRGGAAIVLGALSPRTRNAQVELYQSGEVDYLVATDAIGMGLNMDIDHVAFASLRKFDGRVHRALMPAELAQIAGRAGRHMSDGTFGTTDRAEALDDEIAQVIETSNFDSIGQLRWRNPELDFRSGRQLLASLERKPSQPGLRRAPLADDQRTLAALLADEAIFKRADNREATWLLWDVCRIPDFRKTMTDSHTRLAAEIFRQLSGPGGTLNTDWARGHIDHLDRTDGDIDTLMNRISHVRTWTYISHQARWLPAGFDWQARTRTIEDKLSDALHGALSQRFIDRRSAVLVRGLGNGEQLAARIDKDGTVTVAEEFVGRLNGFSFSPDSTAHREDTKAILSATRRALALEIERRVASLESDSDSAILLTAEGALQWRGADLAQLRPGKDIFKPKLVPTRSTLLDSPSQDRILARLRRWLADRIGRDLASIKRLDDHSLKGPARGIAFQLREHTGCLPRQTVANLIEDLGPGDRAKLRELGVRIGSRYVFAEGGYSARARRLLSMLLGLRHGKTLPLDLPKGPPVSWKPADGLNASLLSDLGYPRVGPLAVRVDRLETMLRRAHAATRRGTLDLQALAKTIGCSDEDLPKVLKASGFRLVESKDGKRLLAMRRGRKRQNKPKRAANAHSPFAELANLA